MERVKFWGISFRSDAHLLWFKVSMTAFVLSFVWYLVTVAMFMGRTGFIDTKIALWAMLLFFHAMIAFQAFVVAAVKFASNEPVNGRVSSIDCIWFNALMATVYFFLYWITKNLAAT